MFLGRFIQDAAPLLLPDSVPTPRQELGMLKSLPVDELLQRLVHGIVTLVINVALAVLVFYAGKFIINKIYSMVRGILLRRRVDSSLASFVLSFVRIVLYFILIVTVIGILGIETSSFLAIFASAGVALGMALSGTLQNFAGGVLILLLKPYRVGDYIEAQGYSGTVKEIQIFHTLIATPDNKSIIIPNGGLSTGSVNNWSREEFRRVDWNIGISYGDSVEVARKAILDIIAGDSRVVDCITSTDVDVTGRKVSDTSQRDYRSRKSFWSRFRSKKIEQETEAEDKSPDAESVQPKTSSCAPTVVLDSLGDSSVNLKVRAWARTTDYWAVYNSVLERIYNELPQSGVSFPFPQLDVHLMAQNSLQSNPENKKDITI